MPERFEDVYRYARAHHGWALLVALGVLGLGQYLSGNLAMVLPSSSHPVDLPLRNILPMGFALVAASAPHSTMNSVEACAASGARRVERCFLLFYVFLSCLVLGVSEAVASSGAQSIAYVRAMFLWLGLALLSGRLFGRALSWPLPMATIFPLAYYGKSPDGMVVWWNWTWQTADAVGCWLLAGVVLGAGLLAYASGPWSVVGQRVATCGLRWTRNPNCPFSAH